MNNSKDEALKKLSMLSHYQKVGAVLDKEEIQKIKQSLKK